MSIMITPGRKEGISHVFTLNVLEKPESKKEGLPILFLHIQERTGKGWISAIQLTGKRLSHASSGMQGACVCVCVCVHVCV